MPRYCCLVDVGAHAAARAMAEPRGALTRRPEDPPPIAIPCNRPATFALATEPVPPGFAPAHEFDAEDVADANRYFRRMQDEGMPMDACAVGDASRNSGDAARMWRFRGDRHYIKARLPDFGLGDHEDKLLQANPQWRQLTSMLGQMCERYHAARKQDGVAQLSDWQRHPIAKSLEFSEQEIARLGTLLAAAIDAQDAAYRAFGIGHRRGFRLAMTREPDAGTAAADADAPNHQKRPHPKPAHAAK